MRPVLLLAALLTLSGCAALGPSPAQTALGIADDVAETYLAFRGKLPSAPPTVPAPSRDLTRELLLELLDYLAQLEAWCTAGERALTPQAEVDPGARALVAQLHQLKVKAVEAQSAAFARLPPPAPVAP
ncbi:MAG: hypothetical protein EKK55_25055 [Rhodocyclaceae bacterium]|nr:MAG: hypothetical protein EKK55_25055 [Rhodocyclaceae bacterium]